MSALVVGIDLVLKYCRHLKYIKNLIMITDGRGHIDWSGSDDITLQIKKENIAVSILGIDFDDAEFGFKEEGKDPTKVYSLPNSKITLEKK
jgi:ATP-dependent DNA helicase 2 subunit 2